MEVSSLFEDLAYSIEIAGHEAGLQHFAARMWLDTATLQRAYRELYVPEDWPEPYRTYAEIRFELDPLAEARVQCDPEDVAEAFGLPPGDPDAIPSIVVELAVRFVLDLQGSKRGQNPDRWQGYLASFSERERLEAGLRNLRGEVRRALQAAAGDPDWDPPLEAEAEATLVAGHGLLAKKLGVTWTVSVNTELEEDEFVAELNNILRWVRAGICAVHAFLEEIRRDYEEVP